MAARLPLSPFPSATHHPLQLSASARGVVLTRDCAACRVDKIMAMVHTLNGKNTHGFHSCLELLNSDPGTKSGVYGPRFALPH
jgi:hypothetical protein